MSKFLQTLTLALSPLYILRAHIILPTTLLEILILLTAIVTGYEFLREGGKLKDLRTRFDLLILFFLLCALIASLITPNLYGGLGILKAYFLEPVIFFYCLVLTSRKEGSGYIVRGLLIASFWLSLLAVLQKITHQFTLAPYELSQGRVSAVYNSANALALFIGPVSLLCFALFIESKKTQKLFFLALFALFSVVMVWTRSRGGLVAETLALIVFVYAVLSEKYRKLKKYWVLLPGVFLVGITMFLYFSFKTYYTAPTRIEPRGALSDTLKIRYYIWAGTVNMLKDHPLFGAGLDGFKALYAARYHLPQYLEDVQYPHNILLTFWTETGILGLASFLLILVSSFGLVMREMFKRGIVKGAGLLGALTYLVIHGVVDVPYFKNDLSIEFWTLIALIVDYSR